MSPRPVDPPFGPCAVCHQAIRDGDIAVVDEDVITHWECSEADTYDVEGHAI